MSVNRAIYDSWRDMVKRCDNPAHPHYKNYGERGITYDPAWKNFDNFCADMEATWFIGGTIDRTNNDEGYNKANCCWIPKADQTTVGRQSLRYNNKTGVKGVELLKPGLWRVIVRERGKPRGEGKKTQLYRGTDFEEACRIRKEWEDRESKILASSLKLAVC